MNYVPKCKYILPQYILPDLHCAVRLRLGSRLCLHDPVESLVGHDPGHEQLGGADVVEGEALDLGDVDAHLTVDARALDAHDHPEVGRQPGGVWKTGATVVYVVRISVN